MRHVSRFTLPCPDREWHVVSLSYVTGVRGCFILSHEGRCWAQAARRFWTRVFLNDDYLSSTCIFISILDEYHEHRRRGEKIGSVRWPPCPGVTNMCASRDLVIYMGYARLLSLLSMLWRSRVDSLRIWWIVPAHEVWRSWWWITSYYYLHSTPHNHRKGSTKISQMNLEGTGRVGKILEDIERLEVASGMLLVSTASH